MGESAIAYARQSRQVLSFGKNLSHDFCFEILSNDLLGVEFQLKGPRGQAWRVQSPLLGEHNVYNLVGALVAIYALGGDVQRALTAWPKFPGVPGRLQRISRENLNIHCFVDYAHTPDALEQVLKTLRKLLRPDQRLITLFGCGGDRDPGKRSLMGDVASTLSDGLWLTSDNPRSEDPQRILLDIQVGVKSGVPLHLEVDRGRAIDQLIQSCHGGEVVLIAGKGHEKTQTIGHQVLPFDDFHRVQEALQRKVIP
jgi:UDP-N-acetylmuramoyl-L-alanyl-D-glutamate--2,6-diaminopimelate ligase